MERSIIALVAAAALGIGSGALAQAPADPRSPPQLGPSEQTQISDAELQTFADIYVDLQETASKFETQLATAKTEQEARDLEARMRDESLVTVAEHGWTAEQYVSVVQAINADPDLTEKTLALIDAR